MDDGFQSDSAVCSRPAVESSGPRLSVAKFTAMGSPCEISLLTNAVDAPAQGRDSMNPSSVGQQMSECTPSVYSDIESGMESGTESRIEGALEGAKQIVADYEARYSRYLDTSLICKINRMSGQGNPVAIDEETYHLLNYADELFSQSGGLFDITSGVLREVWDFRRGQVPTVCPQKSSIKKVLKRVGWRKVEFNRQQVYLPLEGMALDFGGIVKEYAVDAVVKSLYGHGFRSGIVDLGGDMRVLGPKLNGEAWPIGIKDPRDPSKAIKTLYLRSGAIATSGTYERYVEIGGVRYSHLLNPVTGWPIDKPLLSVTVIADHALLAGSVTTIAILRGERAGIDWLASLDLPYIAMRQNGQIQSNIIG